MILIHGIFKEGEVIVILIFTFSEHFKVLIIFFSLFIARLKGSSRYTGITATKEGGR